MAKIAFIGAGSTIFAKRLMGDILLFPELRNVHLALHDIDAERLRTSEIVAHKVAKACNAQPEITATLDRQQALAGADYVICMIQVGGYKPATVIDFEVPKKYGLRQTIADTLGIGGIMRGLRTIPVLLDIVRDMENLCPDALFINYANPMVSNCWAISRASSISTIGLCHSVPYTARDLAIDIGIEPSAINYVAAGINHMAFFLRYERNGEDLYPKIKAFAEQEGFPVRERGMIDGVRYEILRRFGYFVTESSEHFSEYVPWFIKNRRSDLLQKYAIPLDEYIRRCETQISEWQSLRVELEDESEPLVVKRSVEYGSLIVHSMETGMSRTVYANVPNYNSIDNLAADVIVEGPCLVDKNGVQPVHVGKLPPQLVALMQTNLNVHALTVEAALTNKREHVYHAAMLDPHTASELDLDQIVAMVDELLETHGDYMPTFH